MGTIIDVSRAANIDYKAISGDTFAPPPVSFTINTEPEDFSTSTLKLRIKYNDVVVKELTSNNGISVTDNVLAYYLTSTESEAFNPGVYPYDVLKIEQSGIITTIQKGTITFIDDSII